MIGFLEKWFELVAKTNWLKTISKETDKYNRIKKKLDRQAYIVNALLKRYEEIYGESFRMERL